MRAFAVLLLSVAAVLPAQREPWLQVAVVADPGGVGPPALAWLRHEVLRRRSDWPADLDAAGPFALRWSPSGFRAWRSDLQLPDGVFLVGEFVVPGLPPVRVACENDGTEEWLLAPGGPLPPRLHGLLELIGAGRTGSPHTVDVAALIGNLLGPAAVGDPTSELLQRGATACGDTVWSSWRGDGELGVRGRGDGGLLLPAALALVATSGGDRIDETFWERPPTTYRERWSMRAYTRRDSDRAEATRQLARSDDPKDRQTLRGMLHADESSQLAAIDAFTCAGDANEVPGIVRAVDGSSDLAVTAAVEALQVLWPQATAPQQEAILSELRKSPVPRLQNQVDKLPVGVARTTTAAEAAELAARTWRLRALVALLVLAVGLHGLWRREQARLDVRRV